MAEIKLRFQISDDGTVKVLDDVREKTEGIGEGAEKASQRASKAFDVMKGAAVATVAAVGAATAATVAAVNRQFTQIDELAKVSRATGVAVRDLSGLQVAADLAGVSLEGVGTALGIFSRRLVEAQSGTGKSGRIFDALGIDPRSGASTQQFLEQIADRFQELGTGAEATALSMELFGRSGARLINLLVGGGEAIREAREEARLFGLVIDDEAAQAVEQFNDNLTRLTGISAGFARTLAVDLADPLAKVTDMTVAWATANGQVVASGIATFVENMIPVMERLGTVAGEVVAQFQAIALWQEGRINATQLLGAYARNALPGGGTSNFRDLVGGFQQQELDLFREYGGGSLLDAIGAAQSYTPGGGGGVTGAVEDALARQRELIEAIRSSMGEARKETAGTATESKKTADEFGRINELAKLTPVELSGVTSEIEAAQVAAVNLGDVLSDSLVSAVDSLIAGGSFDLGDVLEATGKSAMSRMVGAMIKEKLGFDAVFKANFLEYLPGIASQGADLISQNFGLGLRSIASQSANAGQVVAGSVGGAFTLPTNAVGASGGVVTFVDDFGNTITAPAAQAGAASAVSQGFTPGAAAAGGGIGAGLLGGLAIGGTLIGGQIVGSLAGSGAFGSRAQANSSLFGAATAAAIAAPFTFGLAPLALALLGSRPPSAAEMRRMAIGDAYREVGLFPSLAFAKNPGSTFRDAPIPGFIDGMSPELSALSLLYGGTANDAFGRIQGTIGSRASVLGLSEEQVRREIRTVAGASGVSLGTAVGDLNTRFLEAQINNKGDLSPSQYLDLVTGTISILGEDLPAGVDAAAVALANLEQVGGFAVVELQAFGEELERQKNLATTLQGGVAVAGQSAITALLTGGDPSAAFRSGILNAAAGGISSQLVGTLFADGGPLGAALTEAVLGGDPDALGAAIASAGDSLEMLTSAAEKFVPVLASLIDVVEDGTSTAVDRSGYLSQRNDLRSRIEQARFSMLSPGAQEDFILRQLDVNSGYLRNLAADRVISEAELPDFDYASRNLVNYGFAALSAANNYAGGSRQQRQLQQAGLNALDLAESGLSLAAEVATMRDVTVTRMVVQSVEFSQSAALSMHGG